MVLIPIWALVSLRAPGVLAVLLVFVKLLDGIALLAFWVALGDMITGRQAKRLFAPLAAGITIGRLLGSFGTEPASRSRRNRGAGSVCGRALRTRCRGRAVFEANWRGEGTA